MKKVLLIVAILISLTANVAFAEMQMPVYNNGLKAVQESVITVMSKLYPDYYLDSQTSNSLIFQNMSSNFFGKYYTRLMFTFANRTDSSGKPYTMVTLQPYLATDSALVREGYTPYNNAVYDNILVYTCVINEGYYYYGFSASGKKIIEVSDDSPAYNAGLRKGDVIKTWDGGTGRDSKVNDIALGRVPTFPRMKLVTKQGKVVDMKGIYISPEDTRQALLEN